MGRLEYKQTLRVRKSEIKQEAWNKLLSVDGIKNSAMFRDIVNKPFFLVLGVPPLSVIFQKSYGLIILNTSTVISQTR